MAESMKLLTQIDATRGRDPLEDACIERPKMREINELYCQIAFGDHTVIGPASKTRKCTVSESTELLTQITLGYHKVIGPASNTRKCPKVPNVRVYRTVDTNRGGHRLENACLEKHHQRTKNTQLQNLQNCWHKSMRADVKTPSKMLVLEDRKCRNSIDCLAKSHLKAMTFKKFIKGTSMCNNVTGILATALWELSFGRPNSDSMHRRVRNLP